MYNIFTVCIHYTYSTHCIRMVYIYAYVITVWGLSPRLHSYQHNSTSASRCSQPKSQSALVPLTYRMAFAGQGKVPNKLASKKCIQSWNPFIHTFPSREWRPKFPQWWPRRDSVEAIIREISNVIKIFLVTSAIVVVVVRYTGDIANRHHAAVKFFYKKSRHIEYSATSKKANLTEFSAENSGYHTHTVISRILWISQFLAATC